MDYSFYLCCCQVSHEVKSIKAFLAFTDNASSYLKIAGFHFFENLAVVTVLESNFIKIAG